VDIGISAGTLSCHPNYETAAPGLRTDGTIRAYYRSHRHMAQFDQRELTSASGAQDDARKPYFGYFPRFAFSDMRATTVDPA
jgi:hypothetical protein